VTPSRLCTSLPAPIYIYAHCLFTMLFLSIISTAYHLISGSLAGRLLLSWLIDWLIDWYKTAQCGDSVTVQEIVAIHCPASGIGKDININLSFMFRGQPSPNDHAFPPSRWQRWCSSLTSAAGHTPRRMALTVGSFSIKLSSAKTVCPAVVFWHPSRTPRSWTVVHGALEIASVVVNNVGLDDEDINREIKNIFNRTNVLPRRFKMCSVGDTIVFFISFC